jgi:nucleoid DNA-binding protein
MLEGLRDARSGQRRSYRNRHDEHVMNSSDLANAIAADHGIAKTDARKILDAVFAAIGDAAAKKGGSVAQRLRQVQRQGESPNAGGAIPQRAKP